MWSARRELVKDDVDGFVFPVSATPADVAECLRKVTAPDRIDSYEQNSPTVLAAWRSAADPVDGLRHAIRACRCALVTFSHTCDTHK